MSEEEIWQKSINSICEVCKKHNARYRCPKCGIVYCEKECYQRHSRLCVNSFAKEMLESVPNQYSTAESNIQMQKIILDQEKARTAMQEVEPWTAWWEKKFLTEYPISEFPPPPKVAPNIGVHMCGILYAYCYTLRLYNGDISFDFEGASDVMISITSILDTTFNPITVKESLCDCVVNSRRPDIFTEFLWQIEVIRDTEMCLQSLGHICRALSESLAIMREAKEDRARKKLMFFFAWASTLDHKSIDALQSQVHEYYTSMRSYYISLNIE